MITLKIVYDVDDILWGLNQKICKEHGIEYYNIKNFKITENHMLTRTEQETLLKNYKDANNFKNIQWYKGVEKITDIQKLSTPEAKIEVYIHSNNMSKEIADIKLEQLVKVINIPKERIILDIIGDDKIGKKALHNDIFILIDDSPYTIIDSTAKYNLSVMTPWLCSDTGRELTHSKNLTVCNNLEDVIANVKLLTRLELNKKS